VLRRLGERSAFAHPSADIFLERLGGHPWPAEAGRSERTPRVRSIDDRRFLRRVILPRSAAIHGPPRLVDRSERQGFARSTTAASCGESSFPAPRHPWPAEAVSLRRPIRRTNGRTNRRLIPTSGRHAARLAGP
jgi:hypothetical protein